MSRTAPLALALLALATALAAGAPRPESRRVDANRRVNGPQVGQYGRVGNALAASADGRRLVAAWDDMQGTCGPPFNRRCTPTNPPGLTGIGISTDGGETWADLGPPPATKGAMSGGHAWLDRGGAGDRETFYLVSRARELDDDNPFVGQIGLLFHRGRFLADGRFAWQDVRYLGPSRPGDFWRGPSVAAAKNDSGKVYLAITNLRQVCGRPSSSGGEIDLLRSEDGGDTWSAPVVVAEDDTVETVDPDDPHCGSHGHFQFTPTLSLGPGGEVYVVWQLGPEFHLDWRIPRQTVPPTLAFGFASSLDGGRTFTHPRVVTTVNSLAENAPAGFSKDVMNDTPRLAVAAGGPHRGRLYLTYAAAVEVSQCNDYAFGPKSYSPLSSQVYLLWSDDRGQIWNGPVPLGPPVPRTGVKRFFPAAAVRADGTVDVVYFESREVQRTADPGDVECPAQLGSGLFRRAPVRSLVDLQWVRSADGGASFDAPLRVTSQTSDWCATLFDSAGFLFPNYGDYLGIAAGRDATSILWADGREGVTSAYFTTLRGGGAR